MNRAPTFFRFVSLPLFAAAPAFADAAETEPAAVELTPVVVTTRACEHPLVVVADAKAPVQPVPAHDGADYLKTVPGFSVIRKGGADGDPMLRGMAGSRLAILIDGESVLGGCGHRMDPPTAYVFPAAYDRITVLKGPQDVLHGPGNSAGVVRFEREHARAAEPFAQGQAAVMLGGFGRRDGVIDFRAGSAEMQGRVSATYSESDDYKDGAGDRVHGAYLRWSAQAALAWTPDPQTWIELSALRSDGEAAYADRAMDGGRFERDNLGLRIRRSDLTPVVRRVDLQVFTHVVDHVMDNFSLRPFMPSMMMPVRSVSNPDRRTAGGRALAELAWNEDNELSVGIDHQSNRHAVRSASGAGVDSWRELPRMRDARFAQTGVFGEYRRGWGEGRRVIVGARLDQWRAHDDRTNIAVGGMDPIVNPTAGATRTEQLGSGFVRWEREFALHEGAALFYAGVGHVTRFPDYWELIAREAVDSASAFHLEEEKTTQLDVGFAWRRGALSLNLAAFAGRTSDFILIEAGVPKGMRRAVVARPIDAETRGGEVGMTWRVAERWMVEGSVAFVHGVNVTEGRPLAQMPPLEGRIGLRFQEATWSLGVLQRVVAAQDRFAINQGNIVGQDLGASPGFAVTSIHAAWRVRDGIRVSAGVDNVFDRAYAEHISRGGAMVSGYVQTTRVREPGRMLWLKLDLVR